MGDAIFTFNDIYDYDINELAKGSNVFNLPREDIEGDKVLINGFDDEKLGSSHEAANFAIYNGGQWGYLDAMYTSEEYNEIPLASILEGRDFTRVMVILRRMSNMVFDTVQDGITTYIYCVVPEKFRFVSSDKALYGLLAKSQVYLDMPDADIKRQVREKVIERDEELCNRLFP